MPLLWLVYTATSRCIRTVMMRHAGADYPEESTQWAAPPFDGEGGLASGRYWEWEHNRYLDGVPAWAPSL